MNEDELSEKLKDAPEAVQNCANLDRVFFERSGCMLGTEFQCPYQSRKYFINFNGQRLSGCTRYSNTIRKNLGLPPNQG
jgi:hypothetical protein